MNLRRRYLHEKMMVLLLILATLLVLVPLFIIIGHVVANGISGLNWNFFTQDLGSPARAQQGRPTGLAHSIIGTIIIDSMALILAIPFGIGAGIMLSEYPDHPLTPSLRILNDTFNGMPAILKGLLAYALIVQPTGSFSGFAGSVALAFVMLPIIARATEGILGIIPWSIREAALALGLPRWRVVLSTTLPAARTGLVTGIIIAFARSAGEAAPLLFTSFGNNFLPRNPWNPLAYLTREADTLPQRLYSLAISPYREWHSMGWGAGIILLLFVVIAFALARLATQETVSKV